MKTMNAKWMLAAGVVCAGGAGVWLMQTDASAPQVDAASKASRPAPGERQNGCTFEAGESLAYHVSTRDVATLDLSGLVPANAMPSGNELRVETSSKLELQAATVEPEGTVFVARFTEVAADSVVDDAKLEEPFLVRIGRDCSIDGFAYKRGVDAGYARVQQALLHELSWAQPTGAETELEVRNGVGSFGAQVRSGEASLTQTFGSFEPWAVGPTALDTVESSLVEIRLGSSPWFEELQGRATMKGPRSTVEHEVRASFLGAKAPSLTGASTDETNYVWADLLPTEIPLAERQPLTKSELLALADARKLTVDEAVDQYVARSNDPNVGIQDSWPPLKTFLEAKPEAAQEVIEKLKRREMPAEATMGAYIALGNAHTPEAKSALEGVMRDEAAPVIERSRAILALIDRPDVGADLAGYLGEKSQKLAGETKGDRVLARQSLLALGAMSGRKAHDEDIKQMALREISQRLEDTRDLSEAYQRPVFGALANVGEPDTLSMIAHIPSHPDPNVREAAAIVFRRMPPAESAEFAAQWLAVETNPNVKRALWHTMELQTFDARANYPAEVLQFAVRDLRERPGPITRKALVRMLARAKAEMPGDDELGIEDLFVELLPYEYEQKSGFEKFMHDAISPERRDAKYLEIARAFDEAGGLEQPEEPGIVIPTVGGANEEVQ